MLVTRLPTAASMLYVKQRPETCAKRPFAPGIDETPCSRNALTSAPVSVVVVLTFPKRSTARAPPRVIGNGGVAGIGDGQKPPDSTCGHVSASRRPPAFVIAKSVPYAARSESVTTLPTSDSQSLLSERPHESERRTGTFDEPIKVPRMGASCAFSSAMKSWIA